MTTDKLLEVLRFYRRWIEEVEYVEPRRDEEYPDSLRHVGWMCLHAEEELVPTGRINKAMRWLGFIQGVLCARGHFTLAQLREHSRSNDEE